MPWQLRDDRCSLFPPSHPAPRWGQGLGYATLVWGDSISAGGLPGGGDTRGGCKPHAAACRQVVAPWRLPEFYQRFPGRRELMDYAQVGCSPRPAPPGTAAAPRWAFLGWFSFFPLTFPSSSLLSKKPVITCLLIVTPFPRKRVPARRLA